MTVVVDKVLLTCSVAVAQDEQEFDMAVYSVVPWFKVIERYPLSGEERQFKRRDLRRGAHWLLLHSMSTVLQSNHGSCTCCEITNLWLVAGHVVSSMQLQNSDTIWPQHV